MSNMLEHMDSYYLRRILRRLVDNEVNQVFPKATLPPMEIQKRLVSELHSCGETETGHAHCAHERQDLLRNDQHGSLKLHELEPAALQALHELVSLVHNHLKINDQDPAVLSTSTNDHGVCMKDACYEVAKSDLHLLKGDPIAKILWTLNANTLQNVLLAMAHNFRRTLEVLILHLLSPVGAEVLTRKFDEMDQLTSQESRKKFYQVFYSAFDDQLAAMDAILNGKESFALQAFKDVLDKYLGVNSDMLKPSSR
uniref:Uncharacterized protein MANES_05G081900 n=1 Tax=Rhizophora mucronata TaxID=61149 RepID=A0A2P2MU00_RHIMU